LIIFVLDVNLYFLQNLRLHIVDMNVEKYQLVKHHVKKITHEVE